MSDILIIKHGSLGDLIQANGAIKDIKNNFTNAKVFLLTTLAYVELMSACPYIDGVIIDERLPRWNLFYLARLKKKLERYKFSKVFDLQNSSRTKFYRRFILKDKEINWSSSETTLEQGQTKSEFDVYPVLDRMDKQLQKSGIKTKHVKEIDLSWCVQDISRMLKKYTNGNFILLFPFCSKNNQQKKWPYFKDLVFSIKQRYHNKYDILVAPGPGEEEDAKKLNAKIVQENGKPISIIILISLIYKSNFIISNDTGPAHIASHLKKKGLVLFGKHTSSKKVSIGNNYFKALNVNDLKDLTTDDVMKKIDNDLN